MIFNFSDGKGAGLTPINKMKFEKFPVSPPKNVPDPAFTARMAIEVVQNINNYNKHARNHAS